MTAPRRRMPAEWEAHERCWMIWPDAPLWEDELEPVEREYAAVAHAIRGFEPLAMIANPHSAARARNMLGSDIEVVEYPVDDAWCRDCGPSFVIEEDADVSFERGDPDWSLLPPEGVASLPAVRWRQQNLDKLDADARSA